MLKSFLACDEIVLLINNFLCYRSLVKRVSEPKHNDTNLDRVRRPKRPISPVRGNQKMEEKVTETAQSNGFLDTTENIFKASSYNKISSYNKSKTTSHYNTNKTTPRDQSSSVPQNNVEKIQPSPQKNVGKTQPSPQKNVQLNQSRNSKQKNVQES